MNEITTTAVSSVQDVLPRIPAARAASTLGPSMTSKPKKLHMALINLLLDTALFFVFVFIMWVSVMMQYVFPLPTLAQGWTLWGLTYVQWRNAQFYALCLCAGLTVEHLVLHWNWVCSVIATHVFRSKSKLDEASQAVYGVGTFIVILSFMMGTLVAALLTVSRP